METLTPAPGGHTPDTQAVFERWMASVAGRGHALDFYQALRRIEAAHPDWPRLGEALRPADEPVRVSQPAEMSFAPTPVVSVERPNGGGPVRLSQRIFGLTGPNGPLPLHLTELARDRSQHHDDPTLAAFLNTLSHRFSLLFYRAWAQAQPTLSLDRAADHGFAFRLGALVGIGEPGLTGRDAAGDDAKLSFAGRLSRQVRDADGLANWCRLQLNLPLQVVQWQGHWMSLGREERTRLGQRRGQALGVGAVLGAQVWDVQHKFRVVIGPLNRDQFDALLPGGKDLARLKAMVRQWVGLEFEWDVQLKLAREHVPPLHLAPPQPNPQTPRLGRSTWLGRFRRPQDADDVVLHPERMKQLRSKSAATPA